MTRYSLLDIVLWLFIISCQSHPNRQLLLPTPQSAQAPQPPNPPALPPAVLSSEQVAARTPALQLQPRPAPASPRTDLELAQLRNAHTTLERDLLAVRARLTLIEEALTRRGGSSPDAFKAMDTVRANSPLSDEDRAPANTSDPVRQKIEIRAQLQHLFQQGNYVEILTLTQPQSPGVTPNESIYWRGKALAALGHPSKARTAFEQAIKLLPTDSWAHRDSLFELARVAYSTGDKTAATAHLRNVVSAQRDDALNYRASRLLDRIAREFQYGQR